MGLTIHYTFSTRRRLDLAGVKEFITPLHAKAIALGFETVGELIEVGPDYPGAFHWPRGAKKFSDLLPPLEGWIFHATPGDGSESVEVGLCRYAGVPGWRLRGFCKTQYASHHGWEHFLKCHRGVVELLWAAEDLGLRMKVQDESHLWETGSHKLLREKLGEYDRTMAAFGGALRDAADESGLKIEGEIFSHPSFEHLEAEGMAAHGAKIFHAVEVVKRLGSRL